MPSLQVTEDAYLTMQQDWLMLKQQEKEKDDKLRRWALPLQALPAHAWHMRIIHNMNIRDA